MRDALLIASKGREGDALAEELKLGLTGMDSGQTQQRALEDMAARMQLEDLSTFVLALNRGEKMGTPMKTTLETQADLIRFKRYERAEKIATEAPVKMMLPNMLIMMATLLVVLGPLLINMLKQGLF